MIIISTMDWEDGEIYPAYLIICNGIYSVYYKESKWCEYDNYKLADEEIKRLNSV